MMRPKFVAGATCAACGAVDRIVVEEFDGGRRRRCVTCRHEETLLADPEALGVAVRLLRPEESLVMGEADDDVARQARKST